MSGLLGYRKEMGFKFLGGKGREKVERPLDGKPSFGFATSKKHREGGFGLCMSISPIRLASWRSTFLVVVAKGKGPLLRHQARYPTTEAEKNPPSLRIVEPRASPLVYATKHYHLPSA